MTKKIAAIDLMTELFIDTTKKSLNTMTNLKIKSASTIMSIPRIGLKPDIGCFIQFYGDYNGLLVFNFSSDSAMKLYRSYMLSMMLPEEELAKTYTSQEVIDCLGEMINQLMGQSVQKIEADYDLNANFNQPKVLSLTSAINLTFDSTNSDNRRVVFKVDDHKFYMEISMEQVDFIVK